MKRNTLILSLVALGLSAAVASVYVGSFLTAPAQKTIGDPPSWLDAETVEIASPSGARVSGWFHQPADPDAVIILMHPVRGNRRSMLGRARFLSGAGFAVLLFDFQAHGESVGDRITFGYLEAMDARAAVTFVKERLDGLPVVVLGSSLGGVAALLSDPPLEVEGMILESVFPDVATAVRNRLRIRLGEPGKILAPLLIAQVRPGLGVNPGWLSPVSRAAAIRAPVFVISGSDDARTTEEDTLSLFEAFQPSKELWIVEGARHQDLHAFAGLEYETRVLNFVLDAVRRR